MEAERPAAVGVGRKQGIPEICRRICGKGGRAKVEGPQRRAWVGGGGRETVQSDLGALGGRRVTPPSMRHAGETERIRWWEEFDEIRCQGRFRRQWTMF